MDGVLHNKQRSINSISIIRHLQIIITIIYMVCAWVATKPTTWILTTIFGSIINIAIGKIASTEVNVDEALQTAKDQIEHSKLGDPKHSTAIFPDKWKHTKRSSQLETLLWLIRKFSMLGWLGYLSAIGPWTSMPYWPVNCLHIHH